MQIKFHQVPMKAVANLHAKVMVIEGFTAEMGEDLAIILQTYVNSARHLPSSERMEKRKQLAKDLADYLLYDEQLAEQRLAEERRGRKVKR